MMKKLFLSILLATGCLGAQAADNGGWMLTQAQWSGVTQASQVAAITPLRQAVKALDAQPGARLVVVHNGGEDGLFWASNLEGWLVSLGVPTDRIVDRIGAIKPGRIRLQIEPAPKG
jgi:hypothetical protein